MSIQYRTLEEHLSRDNVPKRILTLDGGGIRGLITLEYLEKIESILRKRNRGDDEFRLCDYFDLIAGTSTGAIIASCLALGWSVQKIREKYRELAKDVFRPISLGVIIPKFKKKRLEKLLKEILEEWTLLGGRNIKTGLMIMSKRIDTTSPWPLFNNPRGKYYERSEGDDWIPNSHFPLWKIVRASTAAPYYFKPEKIEIAREEINGKSIPCEGIFVDGGVSTSNNPALQALKVAVLKGFNLCWELSEDNLLLVSVGTGRRNPKRDVSFISAKHAVSSLLSMMDDCDVHVETILQWLSNSKSARVIDGEIGDLCDDLLCSKPLLTYLRYNLEFNPKWISENIGKDYTKPFLKELEKMDKPKNVEHLIKLGQAAAEEQVKEDHFPERFDLP